MATLKRLITFVPRKPKEKYSEFTENEKQIITTIVSRAYTICPSEKYHHEEIRYIESTFEEINNYPRYVANQLNCEVKLKHTENMNIKRSTINQTTLNKQEKRHLLVLPYAGNKGEIIMKLMNKFPSRV